MAVPSASGVRTLSLPHSLRTLDGLRGGRFWAARHRDPCQQNKDDLDTVTSSGQPLCTSPEGIIIFCKWYRFIRAFVVE